MANTPEGSGATPVPPATPRIVRGYGIVPSSPQRPPLAWGVEASTTGYHRRLSRKSWLRRFAEWLAR